MDPTKQHILLLDHRSVFAEAMATDLTSAGYQVHTVSSTQSALHTAREILPNIVIKAEMRGSRSTGAMEALSAICPDIEFIFVSAQADVRMAMRAVRRGAFDCLPLPCSREQLLESVQRALEHQRTAAQNPEILARLRGSDTPNILVGNSPALLEVQNIIERVATSEVHVLVQGESGTGKELVARLLHEKSYRAHGPFVAVNCAALPDSLIESELFGHVRGAFTGALADKPGRFALASGGTLFLDEIGELSPLGQADLLRVLEDGIYRPIGSHKISRADARIVAATNRDLEAACREGRFREDLYYRLNVIALTIPPLRERPADIPQLAAVFVQHFCARHRRPPMQLSRRLIRELTKQSWPGNVRQLRNVIERMVLLNTTRVLDIQHLPAHLSTGTASKLWSEMTLEEAQSALLTSALRRFAGNKSRAAAHLGISRRTLHAWLAKFSQASKASG